MKNWDRYIDLHGINTGVKPFNKNGFDFCVVIPCFDEPEIEHTLFSLERCKPIAKKTAVIVLVNSGEGAGEDLILRNRNTYEYLVEAVNASKFKNFELLPLIYEKLAKKHAGAGFARKLGMDFAIWLFWQNRNKNGVIISLDADTTIQSNFFSEISCAYAKNPRLGCTTQYFEHPLDNNDTRAAIVSYELYLRYFRWALFYSGFPYAIHTIGSCFTVKADVYVSAGGMNRRQGGEDFYFLHKVVPNTQFQEINSTSVFPSSRPSHRVPFGTGAAISQLMNVSNSPYLVYHPDSFEALKAFFTLVPRFYKSDENEMEEILQEQHESISHFILDTNFIAALKEVKRNAASLETFTKRFFQKMDAFQVVKYLNEAHVSSFQKIDVNRAVQIICTRLHVCTNNAEQEALLLLMRRLDLSSSFV